MISPYISRESRTVICRSHFDFFPGYAGGTHYTTQGGASDYLCLPQDPQWGNHNDAVDTYAGEVWGAEYQFQTDNPYTSAGLVDQDVPCAVCRAKTRTTTLMIPGRQDCYSGWTKEYSGYLTTEHKTFRRRQYACMDGAPEALTGGAKDENGALFYPVEARCGSLPCPPYSEGRELTCVVCSK